MVSWSLAEEKGKTTEQAGFAYKTGEHGMNTVHVCLLDPLRQTNNEMV